MPVRLTVPTMMPATAVAIDPDVAAVAEKPSMPEKSAAGPSDLAPNSNRFANINPTTMSAKSTGTQRCARADR